MKKAVILWIALVVIFILIASLIFHLLYFNEFYKNVRHISESDKQIAIEILNKSINLKDSQIKVGNIYSMKNKDLVKIELIKNHSRRYYLIDLENKRIIG